MRLIYDPDQRKHAVRIERAFPNWLIMWGAHSRQFWAYPRFRAPRGTIVHSASAGDLAGMMRQVEHAAGIAPHR